MYILNVNLTEVFNHFELEIKCGIILLIQPH